MDDDGGVLGRLPRSRLGTRSEKREHERPGKTSARAARASEQREPAEMAPAERAAGKASTGKTRAAAGAAKGRATGAERRGTDQRAAAGRRAGAARPTPPPHSAPPPGGGGPIDAGDGGPIGDALRVTTRVAEGGLKLATGLTREVLRRLPRP
jgi:hypothetical protein